VNLRQILEVFNSLQNLEKTYSHLRKGLANLFQAQACSFALLDAVQGEIVAQTPQYGGKSETIPRHRFRLSDSRVSKIMLETGEVFLTNDVPQDPLFEPLIAAEGLQNLLATAMRTPAGPVGFIYVVNRPGGFSQLEAELLMVTGAQVALAVQSAHTFEVAYQEAITDPLTELYNRRFFDVRLKQEVERARRAKRPIALLFLDIDRFKQVNDQYGHQVGNLVISQVARVIRQNCRSADVAARWGGDEFTMLFTEANPSALEMVACRIRDSILQTKWDPVGSVTVTMGIATMPEDAQTLEELLRAADEAMYAAKKQGRNTYVLAQSLRRRPNEASNEASA
jgi:diguanylate cyclase (GGDEF)-like protein